MLEQIEEEFEAITAIYEDDGVIEEAPALVTVSASTLIPAVK